jgi:hypothetical protein
VGGVNVFFWNFFSGEEGAMIHRAAWLSGSMSIPWDKMSRWLMLSFLVKIPNEITTLQGTEKI